MHSLSLRVPDRNAGSLGENDGQGVVVVGCMLVLCVDGGRRGGGVHVEGFRRAVGGMAIADCGGRHVCCEGWVVLWGTKAKRARGAEL